MPERTLSRRARFHWPMAAAASAGLASLARFGYTFGLGDHLVLMPKGLSLADPGALRNDWFVASAPQPHWAFDFLTWAGTRLDALAVVYFLYWVASLVAFGTAAVWLCRRFLPGREWAAVLLGPILAAGPEKILGSTTPLLGVALPHMLGGCLALAALAALLNGYWRACAFTAVAAGLMHIQHGADLVPILVCAALFAQARRRDRALVAGAGVLLVGIAVIVAQLRSIESGGQGWQEVCRTVIPYHCNADTWPPAVLLSGGLVIVLALSLVAGSRAGRRLTLVAVALPAVGLGLAVTADLLDVPIVESLVKASNAYRLSALVVPFAALAILRLTLGPTAPHGALRYGTAFALMLAWILGPDASAHPPGEAARLLPALALLAACLVAVVGLARAYTKSAQAPVPLAAACALIIAGLVIAGGGQALAFGSPTGSAAGAAAVAIGTAVPDGGIIAASPALTFLPNLSRRAVVADCKRVPYGGAAWEEYKVRIAALGGWDCGPDMAGFARLSSGDVEALGRRFGVTHVLLAGDDPKQPYARQNWRTVLTVEPATEVFLERGWDLFELPAS